VNRFVAQLGGGGELLLCSAHAQLGGVDAEITAPQELSSSCSSSSALLPETSALPGIASSDSLGISLADFSVALKLTLPAALKKG
jgi:hypothetical protein